jgi:hypothetical protein
MDIKNMLSNLNKKDAIIMGVLALLVLGLVIALITFVALNWKWIVGIGIVGVIVAGMVFGIIKYIQSKTPTA